MSAAGHDPPHAHAHGGGHDHAHAHVDGVDEGRIRLVLGLSLAWMVVELVTGLWVGSLALVADAGHMTGDVGALLVVLFALRVARRPADPRRTYGYHRAEVLAASVNGVALLVAAGAILWEAAERLAEPSPVQGLPMTVVAAGGLGVNLVGLAVLAAGRRADLNLRAAWLHAVSDALGSVGGLAAGVAVWGLGWTWADPAVSIFIAVLILRGAVALLREAVDVLMEGVPDHVDLYAVRRALLACPEVREVHDLHVWAIGSRQVTLSAHLVTGPGADLGAVLRRATALLRERFGIEHATIQVEPPDFEEGVTHP